MDESEKDLDFWQAEPAVPQFYLYGEPHRTVDETFVHLETLDERSRPNDWMIHTHTHTALNHIFHIASGGGALQTPERQLNFVAPCLLLVPAEIAHGFQWRRDSVGSVVTLATARLKNLCERDTDLHALFRGVASVALQPYDATTVYGSITSLVREHEHPYRGQRAAVDAALLELMVVALRGLDSDALEERAYGAHAKLVARLHAQIEERFRMREPIATYARALDVSLFQLRTACARVGKTSPSELIDHRTMREAKRMLRDSDLSIAEVAFSLGFTDAAYFSRFFARHAGCSPRTFRRHG